MRTMKPSQLPFLGKTYVVSYGETMTARNIYAEDGRSMRYEVIAGPYTGATAEVQYEATQLATGVFVLSWQEADKGTVVHVDDFENGASSSFYTAADGTFYRMAGPLTPAE